MVLTKVAGCQSNDQLTTVPDYLPRDCQTYDSWTSDIMTVKHGGH